VNRDIVDDITGYVWSGSAPSQRRKHVDMDPSFFSLQFSSYPDMRAIDARKKVVKDSNALASFIRTLDRLPVIDTHKIGILYVAPGQVNEVDILRNTHGSPAYTRFLDGLGRLIQVGGQHDVYVGGLEPDEDGNYAYAWWDDIGQMLFHTATLMPTHEFDPACNMKKRHIGNDLVRIVWNDSGVPYRFDTLVTEFQFVNIVIEPHSRGVIAAYSNNLHENEYFRVTVQSAEGMSGFTPIGDFKIASAASLPLLVRQLALVADWYASVFKDTVRDTERNEIVTNWRARLEAIKRFSKSVPAPLDIESQSAGEGGIMGQESLRDFAPWF
jgi:tuberous sclerosis 2